MRWMVAAFNYLNICLMARSFSDFEPCVERLKTLPLRNAREAQYRAERLHVLAISYYNSTGRFAEARQQALELKEAIDSGHVQLSAKIAMPLYYMAALACCGHRKCQ